MDKMQKLDEAARIRGQLNELQELLRNASAANDLARVNALQAKIADLVERQRRLLSQ
jgi:uncharacterized membrane protein (DUF106 family)